MENEIFKKIIKLSKKAYKKKCVPIGCVIIDENNKVIGKGYNKKEKTSNPLDHAEIIAIKQATKKLKSWKLNKCTIYVTMKPCEMCKRVILEARINKIYYMIDNFKEEYKAKQKQENLEIIKINEQMFVKKYYNILKTFFKKLRKNNK